MLKNNLYNSHVSTYNPSRRALSVSRDLQAKQANQPDLTWPVLSQQENEAEKGLKSNKGTLQPKVFSLQISKTKLSSYLSGLSTKAGQGKLVKKDNNQINTLGEARHFPAAIKEWSSSVYCYKKSFLSGLVSADENLNRIIRTYLHLSFKAPVVIKRKKPLPSKVPLIFKPLDFLAVKDELVAEKPAKLLSKQFSLDNIFVSKPLIKHTSNKVIITLYVYNEEKRRIETQLRDFYSLLFPTLKTIHYYKNYMRYNRIGMVKQWMEKIKQEEMEKKEQKAARQLALLSGKKWVDQAKPLVPFKFRISHKVTGFMLRFKQDLYILSNLFAGKTHKLLFRSFLTKYAQHKRDVKTNPVSRGIGRLLINRMKKLSELMVKAQSHKMLLRNYYYNVGITEFYEITHLIMRLSLNQAKFENKFLARISPIISKLYNKDVEFNVVDLKTPYLNSDILTEIISFKLKDRTNTLARVLSSALSIMKVVPINRHMDRHEQDNRAIFWANKVKNLKLEDYLVKKTEKPVQQNDPLNELLLDISPSAYEVRPGLASHASQPGGQPNLKETVQASRPDLPRAKQGTKAAYLGKPATSVNTYNQVLDLAMSSIKYTCLAGARLEGRGRLTKRFTASRAVFKVKWIGGLKTIESSFRSQSVVTLRGQSKPNVQYTLHRSKTRNGAFGLKGWIAGR